MDNNREERCIICGDRFDEDDEKIYCPDCGAPMHKDCYEMEGSCPNTAGHKGDGNTSGNRLFPDGNGCEICGKPFEENDERVYCPDCGAAMHRLCYNMTHQCPFEGSHTPRPSTNRMTRKVNGKPMCDKCGKELDNGEEKVYCPVCGTPVHKSCWDMDPVCPNESRHAEGFDWEKVNQKPEQSPANDFYNRRSFDPAAYESFPDMIESHPIISPESGEELTCRGVKQKELVHFLGMNNFSTPRFFTLFMNMANGGKVLSLNLSAWFFVPLYHYYRRMTGPAVILTLATFILTVPSLMYQVLFFRNMNETAVPDLQFSSIVTITSYIMIIFRIILLLFNDYFYMRWSVNKILSLRERYKDASPDEYYAALERKGNPKMLYVLGGISLMLFLVYILNVFLSYTGIMQ